MLTLPIESLVFASDWMKADGSLVRLREGTCCGHETCAILLGRERRLWVKLEDGSDLWAREQDLKHRTVIADESRLSRLAS